MRGFQGQNSARLNVNSYGGSTKGAKGSSLYTRVQRISESVASVNDEALRSVGSPTGKWEVHVEALILSVSLAAAYPRLRHF